MAGYSSTPLQKNLGIKPGDEVYVLDPPKDYFTMIASLPPDVIVKETFRGEFDFIHLFVRNVKSMQKQLARVRKNINSSGMMWVSWPEKASKVEADLDESKIREFGLSLGLVDIKVCAVDESLVGLKFVIPLLSDNFR